MQGKLEKKCIIKFKMCYLKPQPCLNLSVLITIIVNRRYLRFLFCVCVSVVFCLYYNYKETKFVLACPAFIIK